MSGLRPLGDFLISAIDDLKSAFAGKREGANDLGTPSWPKDSLWWRLYERCESPIECLMCMALSRREGFVPVEGVYDFDRIHALISALPEKRGYLVFSQQPILNYRVDFSVVFYDAARDHFERAVIECDGWKYHMGAGVERLVKDRKRDSDLARLHIPVFRFTGSQIYRAAAKLVAGMMSA